MFYQIVVKMEQMVRTSFNFTFSTTAEEIEKILKTVFEFWWLKPSLSRDRSLTLLGLRQLNVLLGDALMNDRILFWKVSILSRRLIFQSNLLHSIIVEGKKSLKNSCVTFIAGILLHCLILYDIWSIQIIK